jgi:hypothetical protein
VLNSVRDLNHGSFRNGFEPPFSIVKSMHNFAQPGRSSAVDGFMVVDDIGQVIAERILKRSLNGEDPKEVIIRLGKPQPFPTSNGLQKPESSGDTLEFPEERSRRWLCQDLHAQSCTIKKGKSSVLMINNLLSLNGIAGPRTRNGFEPPNRRVAVSPPRPLEHRRRVSMLASPARPLFAFEQTPRYTQGFQILNSVGDFRGSM